MVGTAGYRIGRTTGWGCPRIPGSLVDMADTPPVVPSVPRRRRRGLLAVLLVVTAVTVLTASGLGTALAVTYSRAAVSTVGQVPFETPLAIPPIAEGTVDAAGRRVFDLTVQPGSTDFGYPSPTATWGVNGDLLGPTLRMRDGEQVLMNVTNEVGEPTNLHWHGMHLPARMDGGPHQMVDPGETWSPTWQVDQQAATLWYHAHLHGTTTQHVYRGVAGTIIVDDDRSAALGLPSDYGVDDIPVIIQDRKFRADGSLDEGEGFMRLTGLLGDQVMANGTIGGYVNVTAASTRLRLVNASTARVYNLGFDDDREFSLIATDGGLLPRAVSIDRLQLSPGERAEIIVTMSPSDSVVLRSDEPDLASFALQNRFSGGDDDFDVLELRAADVLAPGTDLPPVLGGEIFGDLSADQAAETRYFQLQGNEINGRTMAMGRIDTVISAGATEIWEVTNGDGYPHNFHVHDVQFRVLDVDGEDPGPVASGRKDTVFVPPGGTARLLIRFGDETDPDHPFMYHCHLLSHEDDGLMGQFVVVAPGTEPGVIDPSHTHSSATGN